MFFKNKNKTTTDEELASQTSEKNWNDIQSNSAISDNIFKELSWWLDFWDDSSSSHDIKPERDIFYYFNLSLRIFIWLNIFVFVSIIFSIIYIKVQNNPNLYSKPILDPFCIFLLSDEMKNTWDYCSSVAALSQDYKTKTESLKNEIVSKLSPIVADIYSIDNFMYSKEISFLLEAKANKLRVVEILNNFDKMKNDFSWWDKQKIVCGWVTITKETIDFTCDAYSSSWETSSVRWWWIVWPTWDRNSSVIEWTSITVALSFLNFIDKNPEYNFKIIDRQKIFTSDTIVWEWPYVRKTNFAFKLKYNNFLNNLSF